jgi:hypothetical protein
MIKFFFLCLFSFTLQADDDQKWAGNLSMNGIELSKYKNFARDWKLVTVRFRQDTGEYRFTYANQKAYDALEKGTQYPEGAAFAKTAYQLGSDPAFPSSLTPHKVVRYQIMLREAKSKTTGGWTYALFDPRGRTFSGEPQEAAMACYSCHQIVEDKNYVFSEIMQKDPQFFTDSTGGKTPFKLKLPTFEKVSVSTLPQSIRALLPADTKMVLSMIGALRKYQFEGTLNEVRPFLSEQSLKQNLPAILMSLDGKSFSLVFSDAKTTTCESGPLGKGHPMMAYVGSPQLNKGIPYADQGTIKHNVGTSSFCYAVPVASGE